MMSLTVLSRSNSSKKVMSAKKTFLKEKDLRLDALIQAKKRPLITQTPYLQVFHEKAGFLSNLSILDALFNLGPNCAFYIKNAKHPIG